MSLFPALHGLVSAVKSEIAPVSYWALDDVPVASMDDDFTGTDGELPDTSLWVNTYGNSSGGSYTLELSSNKLFISAANDPATTYVRGVATTQNLYGDFDVQVDLDTIAFTGTGTRYFVMLAAFLEESPPTEAYIAAKRTAASLDRWAGSSAGSESEQARTGDSGKLRIVRTGSSISCQIWNGSSWVVISSTTGGKTSPCYIAIRAQCNGDGTGTSSANIDNFTRNSGNYIERIAADSIGTSRMTYHGEVSQGVSSLVTTGGTAVTFDGVSSYASRADSGFGSADSLGSIELFVRIESLPSTGEVYALFSLTEDSTNAIFALQVREDSGSVRMAVAWYDGTTSHVVRGSTNLSAATLYMLTITSDGAVWKLYVNDGEETPEILVGSNNGNWIGDMAACDNVTIGTALRTTTDQPAHCTIDEVRYYNYTRSASQIYSRYSSGTT